ncbi:C5a anaphylatoxin chemotactic receptor 1 [Electrophorus electricus]|uniref:G-protein coupled receptors family 1 profile domain-containing protein n=1 Tax=Electrophorus electricus TaxID=8005 RepID=A0A4W4GA29_ELEEL|nr:C5a anaphylatoxin chemotactic receptor 1 [Electrophorus electricus]
MDYYEEFDFDILYNNSTLHPCIKFNNCTFLEEGGVSVMGWRHTVALVCYGLVVLLGVPGNGLVVWVTAFRMPRSVNALWFMHLALADLLCCLSLPLLMVPLAQDLDWPFGLVACKILPGLLYMMMFCSVLLLTLISLDRWLLVSQPAWCQNWRHPRWANWACLCTWLLALLASLPQFIHTMLVTQQSKKMCLAGYNSHAQAWGSVLGRVLLGFLVPFLVISMSHWKVYQRAGSGPGRHCSQRSARTLRVILAVVLSFFLCWMPLHAVDIAELVLHNADANAHAKANLHLAQVLALCLAYFNSCLNPLLYVCLGRSFRESITKSLRSVLQFASEGPTPGLSMTAHTKSTTDTNTLMAGVKPS